MRQEDKDVVLKAIQKWGSQRQILMLLEEMSELQKEILKNMNRGRDNLNELIDEAADVEIMLEQFKTIYGIHQAIEERIPQKIKKLKAKLEE